jgi:hypothetical protein
MKGRAGQGDLEDGAATSRVSSASEKAARQKDDLSSEKVNGSKCLVGVWSGLHGNVASGAGPHARLVSSEPTSCTLRWRVTTYET